MNFKYAFYVPLDFLGYIGIGFVSSLLDFAWLRTAFCKPVVFHSTESEDHSMSQEQLMDIREVAKYLRVKDSTVYTWAQEGKLPAFRLGRLWRFRRDDLESWLENKRCDQAQEEPSFTEI